jgi:hypothetical protein
MYFGDFRLETVPEIPEPIGDGDLVSEADAGLLLDLEPFRCASIATLDLSGGLRIPGRHRARWLRSRPPEITVVIPNATEGISLEIANEQKVLHTFPVSDTTMTIAVESLNLGADRYSVVLRDRKQSLVLERFRLVNAETPSRGAEHRTRMGHIVSRPETLPMISAQEVPDDAPRDHTWLDGLTIIGDLNEISNTSSNVPPATSQWGKRDDKPAVTASKESPMTSPCLNGGHHRVYPKLVPPGEPKPKDQRSRCKICKRYWPAESRRAPKRGAVAKRVIAPPPAPRTASSTSVQSVAATSPKQTMDFGPIFEAMCHLREGSADDLRRLVRGLGGDSLDLHELLPALHALGHCEVIFGDELRPLSWRIAPTTLISVRSGCARVVGFRSSAFFDKIAALSEQHGMRYDITDLPGLPQRVQVHAANIDTLKRFATSLHDESTGGSARLQEPDLVSLVRSVPPLSVLESHLPRSGQPPARILEYWDHESTKWITTDDVRREGAYRFVAHAVVYGWQRECLPGESRQFLIGTHAIVKHLEARRRDLPLLYFDSARSALCVRQGADLPPLLHRIACTASGDLPAQERDPRSDQWILRYEGITAELASAIYDRMMT